MCSEIRVSLSSAQADMGRLVVLFVSVLLALVGSASSRDFTLTIKLGAGRSECFYDYIHEGAFLEIEYQVIAGGDLDVTFTVTGPSRQPLVTEPHSMDGLHGLDVKETGEYEICLDNTFSRMTGKTVFFDIIIEDDSGDTEPPKEKMPYELTKEGVFMDMKIKDLMEKLNSIGKKLGKVTFTQNYFQARESRHKHTVESNNARVQWWSLLQCSVIIAIGVIQVFVVRSLFKLPRRDKIRT